MLSNMCSGVLDVHRRPTAPGIIVYVTIVTPDEVNSLLLDLYPSAHRSGFRCEAIEEGRATARWTFDATELRPGGYISGPTQFTIADTALWFLVFSVIGLEPMAVTSDMQITFLRPAVGGDLISEATLLRAGKTRITGRVETWVDGTPDRLVSHAVGSYSLPPTNPV